MSERIEGLTALLHDNASIETITEWANWVLAIGNESATIDDRKMLLTEVRLLIAEMLKDATMTLTNKTLVADGQGNAISNLKTANLHANADIAMSQLEDLTASRVAQIDANGKLEASNVIPPVLAFLDATSSVQTQLNAKAATVHTHASPLTLTSGGYGTVLSTYALSATGTSISGQPNFKIYVNIPTGAVIVGAALRVDSILSTSASAAYTAGGSAQSIGSIAAAQDSKLETFFDVNTDTPITSNVTFITITADAEVNFDDSTGSITVVVYYQWITPMNDVGV